MKKVLCCFLACFFSWACSYGQSDDTKTDTATNDVTTQDMIVQRPVYKRPFSVSLHGGTQGIGGSVKLQLTRKWFVRLGVSTIPINYPNEIAIGDYTSKVNLNTNFTNIHLFGEWRPFKRSAFRLVGGFGWFTNAKMGVTIQPDGVYSYGYIALTGAQVGSINASLDWKGIAPYLGIGLWKGIPVKHRLGINMDMGTYYLSKPNATIVGTNLLSGNSDNTKQLNENAAGYRWLPTLQLNFSYKIIK